MPNQNARQTMTAIPSWLKTDRARQDDAAYAGMPDPTDGMSVYQLLMAGAGQNVADAGLGLVKAAGGVAPALMNPRLLKLMADYPAELNRPLERNFYGRIGDIVGTAMPIAPAAGMLTKGLLAIPTAYGLAGSLVKR